MLSLVLLHLGFCHGFFKTYKGQLQNFQKKVLYGA
jgi:hypothetical protein